MFSLSTIRSAFEYVIGIKHKEEEEVVDSNLEACDDDQWIVLYSPDNEEVFEFVTIFDKNWEPLCVTTFGENDTLASVTNFDEYGNPTITTTFNEYGDPEPTFLITFLENEEPMPVTTYDENGIHMTVM